MKKLVYKLWGHRLYVVLILALLLVGYQVCEQGQCSCPAPAEQPTIIEDQKPTVIAEAPAEPQYYEMPVTATAYCPCVECSEQWGRMTATGVLAEQGRTIAVDPSIIPYGTNVIINGNTYVAEDCGGAIKGNRIDIYFDSHEEALRFGRQNVVALLEI